MSIALLQQVLLQNTTYTLSIQSWLSEQDVRAGTIEIYRRYVNGSPDDFLTSGQRSMINLKDGINRLHLFSDNYCPSILNTTLDRVQLTGIEADDDTQQAWIDDLLDTNRLDELQVNVHEATLRDGDSYIMVSAVENADGTRSLRYTAEPAYDGYYGMVTMYQTIDSKQPEFAAKIWRITTDKLSDTVRINVYFPNRIERYTAFVGGGIRPYGNDVNVDVLESQYQMAQQAKKGEKVPLPISLDPTQPPGYPPAPDDNYPSIIPYTMDNTAAQVVKNPDGTVTVTGEPIGIPVVHFRNKGSNISTYGISELKDVIPLQDQLNRLMYDMAATSMFSAFPIRAMIGAQFPTAIEPGMVSSFYASTEGLTDGVPNPALIEWLKTLRFEQFDQAELVPYISQAEFLKNEMFAVTNTPEMEGASATASGESLRQREVKLIGKVTRFETRNGNAWEDLMRLSARVQTAFSAEKPPELGKLNAKWADAEIRNDTTTQANALLLFQNGLIDQKTCLGMMADIYDWDDQDIDRMVADTEKARVNPANQLGAGDAQGAQSTLERLGIVPPSGANGATGGSNGTSGASGGMVKTPAPTQSGASKVTTNGQQDTPGA